MPPRFARGLSLLVSLWSQYLCTGTRRWGPEAAAGPHFQRHLPLCQESLGPLPAQERPSRTQALILWM